MIKSEIIKFAKDNGYTGVRPLGRWKEYEAYEPTFGNDMAFVGPPLMILVKGEEIRMSTEEEAFEQISESDEDEEEEEETVPKANGPKNK